MTRTQDYIFCTIDMQYFCCSPAVTEYNKYWSTTNSRTQTQITSFVPQICSSIDVHICYVQQIAVILLIIVILCYVVEYNKYQYTTNRCIDVVAKFRVQHLCSGRDVIASQKRHLDLIFHSVEYEQTIILIFVEIITFFNLLHASNKKNKKKITIS